MRRMHQLFSEADHDKVRKSTTGRGRNSLCWYPSAGSDFRHVRFIESELFADHPTCAPPVYLHSDMHMPWKAASAPMQYESGDTVGPGTWVSSVSELTPKHPLREVSNKIYYSGADENTGKVFLIDLIMEHTFRGRTVHVPIPIIYFVAENLSFMVDLLLRHQMHIDTLIHVKDGGASMGGSKIPMNFIYQASWLLKLKRVICDESPETKGFNTRTDFGVLSHQLLESEQQQGGVGLRGGLHEQIREISESEIRATWEGHRIQKSRLAPNWATPIDGFYYDWHPRRPKKSEQSDAANALPRVADPRRYVRLKA